MDLLNGRNTQSIERPSKSGAKKDAVKVNREMSEMSTQERRQLPENMQGRGDNSRTPACPQMPIATEYVAQESSCTRVSWLHGVGKPRRISYEWRLAVLAALFVFEARSVQNCLGCSFDETRTSTRAECRRPPLSR